VEQVQSGQSRTEDFIRFPPISTPRAETFSAQISSTGIGGTEFNTLNRRLEICSARADQGLRGISSRLRV
jgi:hypothetical protein